MIFFVGWLHTAKDSESWLSPFQRWYVRGGGGRGARGGVLLKMAYRGRLRSKWVPFPGLKYMKGENDLKGQKYTSTTRVQRKSYLQLAIRAS